MEPDYGWLQGLERANAQELLILLREIKSRHERAQIRGPVLVSDTGPTEGGLLLPFDQMQWLREDRASWLGTLWRRGFIAHAEHIQRQDQFLVDAPEVVVREAIVLLADPRPSQPASEAPVSATARQALGEVAKGALNRGGEIAVDVIMKQAPLLWQLWQAAIARSHGG